MFASFKTPDGADVFVVASKVSAVGTSGNEGSAMIVTDNGSGVEVKGTARATRNALIRAAQNQPADATTETVTETIEA